MLFYINCIYEYADRINKSNSFLQANDQNSDGVIYKFIQLREEAKNISKELLEKNAILEKNIQSLIGFRNRLTHDYENVSYTYFDEILEHNLVELKNEIEKILEK